MLNNIKWFFIGLYIKIFISPRLKKEINKNIILLDWPKECPHYHRAIQQVQDLKGLTTQIQKCLDCQSVIPDSASSGLDFSITITGKDDGYLTDEQIEKVQGLADEILARHELEKGYETWWVIHGDDLMDLMRRAAAGEDPDMLYIEAYANCEHPEEEE